jgi:hypothetical protein
VGGHNAFPMSSGAVWSRGVDGVVLERVEDSDGSKARRCHQEQRAMVKGRCKEDSLTRNPDGGIID